MDDRLVILLRQRSVRCTIRKSPWPLQLWFSDNIKLYNILWVRTDKNMPPVKGILNDLFTLLKFIALPNNKERKLDLLEIKWPILKERIDAL